MVNFEHKKIDINFVVVGWTTGKYHMDLKNWLRKEHLILF